MKKIVTCGKLTNEAKNSKCNMSTPDTIETEQRV